MVNSIHQPVVADPKSIEALIRLLAQSPRFLAATLALWEKVEIVEICERAGKPINNFTVTILVQGAQIKHAADFAFEDHGAMSIEGGGHVNVLDHKYR